MRKTTKEMIEVMQAYEDGAEIECFDPDDPNFKLLTEPLWNWLNFDYRVKPKPREIWVNSYAHREFVHDSKEGAADSLREDGKTTHFRQVIDE